MKIEDILNDINAVDKIDFKGKLYTTVATRIEIFRKHCNFDYGISTEIIKYGSKPGETIVMKATISDKDGFVIGTGTAAEIVGEGYINKTSALENCETSCIGRALSSLSLHGGEYASLNEIEIAEGKEKKINKTQPENKKVEEKKEFNWSDWVDTQIKNLNGMTTNGLVRWTVDCNDQLIELGKINKPLHTKLFNAYTERKQNARST